MEAGEQPPNRKLAKIRSQLVSYQQKVPLLRKIPPRAVGIILLLIAVNVGAWVAVLIVLVISPGLLCSASPLPLVRLTISHVMGMWNANSFSGLLGTAVLAYTLGLRHALDADHISAIDLMTRRLVAAGQRPVTVGTFFSLGHSTIVIITSIVVAATASSLTKKFDSFSYIGGIVGSSVSAAFLLILGIANAYIMFLLVRQMRKLLRSESPSEQEAFKIEGAGCLFRVFKKAFKLVDRPWKMYPLGILFGLGFDTSSEIALLGLAALQSARGTSLWLILLFPLVFTVGMCLLDTTDGALMLSLYTSVNVAKDPVAILYYNIVLTGLTVTVAVVIGVLQILNLVLSVMPEDVAEERSQHGFWAGVASASDHYDIIGGAICGAFIIVGICSVIFYKPWRKWMERKHPSLKSQERSVQEEEQEAFGVEPYEAVAIEHRDQLEGSKGALSSKSVHEDRILLEERELGESPGPSRQYNS